MNPLRAIGRVLAQFLSKPRHPIHSSTSAPGLLEQTLQRGDVLLVEGTSRMAGGIKYITQSAWSHAALYVGPQLDMLDADGAPCVLVEADVNDGVRAVSLQRYLSAHTRICRPVGLSDRQLDSLCIFATAQLGNQYDLRNLFDLARYLIRRPPVPRRFRRRLLGLGSGDPTRAICSSLIAAAFEHIYYPVLPDVSIARRWGKDGEESTREILHIRDSRLYAPRDFDVSPYFAIIKPTLEHDFNPHQLLWGDAISGD